MTISAAWEEVDDRDLLDDAALWAAIDSATATTTTTKQPPSLKRPFFNPPQTTTTTYSTASSSPADMKSIIFSNNNTHHTTPPPSKIARSHIMPIVVHHTTPPDHHYKSSSSPSYGSSSSRSGITTTAAADSTYSGSNEDHSRMMMNHSLSGLFPSVSLFKEYQSAALAILEKSDYILISGSPFIKKTGWRKISCYFNISYEIKDKTIEFDGDRNVQRAEFVVRAYMHGGRFSDGWGSCDRREKRFLKPNNDIPSTAETRAKNKACQDLLGIGGPGANRAK